MSKEKLELANRITNHLVTLAITNMKLSMTEWSIISNDLLSAVAALRASAAPVPASDTVDKARAWDAVIAAREDEQKRTSLPAPAAAPTRDDIVKPISFMDAMNMVDRGFDAWKDKPHNAKWYAHIDGTPIPNDLKVNIAEAICHYFATTK